MENFLNLNSKFKLEEYEFQEDDFELASSEAKESFMTKAPSTSYFQDALRRLKENKIAMVSLGFIIIVFIFAFIGPYFVEGDYTTQFRGDENLFPCAKYPFGTDNLYITTDDGSYGRQGFVTQVLEDLIKDGKKYDHVLTIGPAIMMKNVVNITKPLDIPTTVSMNSIMVDGTGMCGCCRLTVGGKMKFACVDGPDFDGFLIDFDEAMNRSRNYATEEREHICNLTGEVRNGKI